MKVKTWVQKNKFAVTSILTGVLALAVTYGILTEDQMQQLINFVLSFF